MESLKVTIGQINIYHPHSYWLCRPYQWLCPSLHWHSSPWTGGMQFASLCGTCPPTRERSAPSHSSGPLLCFLVSSTVGRGFRRFPIKVYLFADIPEFLALTTTPNNMRFGIKLFIQCQTNWDTETEAHFYITRLVTLYMWVRKSGLGKRMGWNFIDEW